MLAISHPVSSVVSDNLYYSPELDAKYDTGLMLGRILLMWLNKKVRWKVWYRGELILRRLRLASALPSSFTRCCQSCKSLPLHFEFIH